jgi:hypothetical protein
MYLKTFIGLSLSVAAIGSIVGCGGADDDSVGVSGTKLDVNKFEKDSKLSPGADAGVEVTREVGLDPQLKTLAARANFGSRIDPFALLAVEAKYDRTQAAERFVQQAGGFMLEWTPPEPPPPEVIEPQPYRRLAGVMVGESVVALIDMGDGRLLIVRPGQQIGNTEWTVVSIDMEKAIIRRSGNKKPKEVVVPLQKPLSSSITGQSQGAGSAGSSPTTGGGGPASVVGAPGVE